MILKQLLSIWFFSSTLLAHSLSQYEILSQIGRGDQAEVFLAQDELGELKAIKRSYSREEVALKVPEEMLDRLFAPDGTSLIAAGEYGVGQMLDHPRILKIESIFNDIEEGRLHTYLIMPYIEGKTLRETPLRYLEKKEALHSALGLIDALKLAFSYSLIHNDLYSSNLLIDREGELTLIDLGSFDELEDEEERTHREYLTGVVQILEMVLALGDFESHELENLAALMRGYLEREGIEAPISCKSATFFISFLNDVEIPLRACSADLELSKSLFE